MSKNSGINIDLSPVTIPGKMSKNGENENNINSNNNGLNENVEKSQNENKINNDYNESHNANNNSGCITTHTNSHIINKKRQAKIEKTKSSKKEEKRK